MRTRDAALACGWLVGCVGCPPPAREPYPSLSRHDVIQAVNANSAWIHFGVKGRGRADVLLTEPAADGSTKTTQHRFQLDAVTLVYKPAHFFMQLDHSLGQSGMEVGANGDRYWLWVGLELDKLWWGKHEHLDRACSGAIPIRPDHLIEALGIADVPANVYDAASPLARVTERWNQLVFVRSGDETGMYIETEYWVDRRDPFRLREIVHRDADGVERMHTYLSDYQPIAAAGADESPPMMARSIRIDWPTERSWVRLSISRWERLDALDTDAAAFVFPLDDADRAVSFRQVEQIDAMCEPQ